MYFEKSSVASHEVYQRQDRRVSQTPAFDARALDQECERVITDFMNQACGGLRFPSPRMLSQGSLSAMQHLTHLNVFFQIYGPGVMAERFRQSLL